MCAGHAVYLDIVALPEWLENILGAVPVDVFDYQSVAADDHPKREDGEHDGKKSGHGEGNKGLTNIGSATTFGALTVLLMQAVPVFLALW